jgi:hypothetical protein
MVESIVPLSNYTHRETELLLKKWNGRIARTSPQLIDILTELEPLDGSLLKSKLPPLEDGKDWVKSYSLSSTYTIGSLYKDSNTIPTPIYVEYANDIRFVPAVYIDNKYETFFLKTRKVDLGEEEREINHDAVFLYGGLNVEDKPTDILVQHIPAVEFPYHIERFAIQDWEYIVILPLFYKNKFYLMILPECDAAKEDPKQYVHVEARQKWKKMIEEEYTDRLLYSMK